MGRPAIRVKLMITSKDDKRFSDPKTFENMLDASLATGLTDRGIRLAYNSGRESMRNRNGFVYDFKWVNQNQPQIQLQPLELNCQKIPKSAFGVQNIDL